VEFIKGGTRAIRAMRYIREGEIPRTVPEGRVLAHNDVRHTVDMPNGRNGFRVWTWSKEKKPPNFVGCECGYAGLPHYALSDHAQTYRCESESDIAVSAPPSGQLGR
jgi:hypothetical protein